MTARGYGFYLKVFNSRYRVKQEKIKFISTSGHVTFFLLYKNTNDDDFPKISEDFPKLLRRPDERFRVFSGHFPKISKEGPMMFRSYSNTSEYFLRDYVAIAMVILRQHDIFPCEITCYFHV